MCPRSAVDVGGALEILYVLTAKHMLGRSLFLRKKRFLAHVQPNINRSGQNFAHTYCCMEYTCGPIYTAIGTWAAPGQTRTTVFVGLILVTHPKSYIETTDRRDFDGKPSKWR